MFGMSKLLLLVSLPIYLTLDLAAQAWRSLLEIQQVDDWRDFSDTSCCGDLVSTSLDVVHQDSVHIESSRRSDVHTNSRWLSGTEIISILLDYKWEFVFIFVFFLLRRLMLRTERLKTIYEFMNKIMLISFFLF